jgi:uncharacterized protein (TIGR04255 family)
MDIKYKNNFLTDVIFEIKFPPVFDLMDGVNSSASNFQKNVIDEFPVANIKKGEEITFNMPRDLNSEIVNSRKEKTSWIFYDNSISENPLKSITLNYNSCILKYKEYDTFDDFFNNIEIILNALSHYPIKKIEYIGLRYINQIMIDGNSFDWDGLINERLHTITSEFVNKKDILRSMHTLEFKEGDYNIEFNFGQFNSEYPNPISKREFVLDYTCRCKDSHDITTVPKISKKMNEIITSWFEKSILSGLRDKMGV